MIFHALLSGKSIAVAGRRGAWPVCSSRTFHKPSEKPRRLELIWSKQQRGQKDGFVPSQAQRPLSPTGGLHGFSGSLEQCSSIAWPHEQLAWLLSSSSTDFEHTLWVAWEESLQRTPKHHFISLTNHCPGLLDWNMLLKFGLALHWQASVE